MKRSNLVSSACGRSPPRTPGRLGRPWGSCLAQVGRTYRFFWSGPDCQGKDDYGNLSQTLLAPAACTKDTPKPCTRGARSSQMSSPDGHWMLPCRETCAPYVIPSGGSHLSIGPTSRHTGTCRTD